MAQMGTASHGPEVIFTSITFFDGIDAVRGFAGEHYEQAVVEDTARRVKISGIFSDDANSDATLILPGQGKVRRRRHIPDPARVGV